MTTAQNMLSALKRALFVLESPTMPGCVNGGAVDAVRLAIAAAEAALAFTTRNVVVLSTLHVRPETWAALEGVPYEDLPFSGGRIGYGWYIYAHEHSDRELDRLPELYACLAWARGQGFDYVQFDADEDPRGDLPAWDQDTASLAD